MARKILYVGDSDVVNKSHKGLLFKAKRKLNKLIIRDFKDDVGRIGFEIDRYIVCSRSKPYGFIVSTNKSLVEQAKRINKKILMYIGQNDAFYEFDPAEIMKTGLIVRRGHEEMWNYDIKLGRRVEG